MPHGTCDLELIQYGMHHLKVFYPELTDKQLSVLHLYSIGLSPKNISTKLRVGESTIREHLKVLRKKFDVGSSIELRVIYLTSLLGSVYKKIDCISPEKCCEKITRSNAPDECSPT